MESTTGQEDGMRRALIVALFGLYGLLFGAGCAQQLSGAVEPGVDVGGIRSFYIVRDKETDVTTAIQKDLTSRGFTVTAGPESTMPSLVDARVLAKDKWMWDITMYLLEVKVEIVHPRTGALLASGRSYRTSLVRKSPQEMVNEVFNKIFPNSPAKH
ncbi:MAG TPA: DUF4136 domain-containing protein [Tepidisphaeraceae bacterium]|jgi:hypothetical protein